MAIDSPPVAPVEGECEMDATTNGRPRRKALRANEDCVHPTCAATLRASASSSGMSRSAIGLSLISPRGLRVICGFMDSSLSESVTPIYGRKHPMSTTKADENFRFGERIAAEMERVGMNQRQFAARIGVSDRTLRSWLADLTSPNARDLAQMLEAGCDIWYVMTGAHSPRAEVLVTERRKLELVAEYADWCQHHGHDPYKSFFAFADAYAAAEIGDDLARVSGIDTIDPRYLSDLYGIWIVERPKRFPTLADSVSANASELVSAMARLLSAHEERLLVAIQESRGQAK